MDERETKPGESRRDEAKGQERADVRRPATPRETAERRRPVRDPGLPEPEGLYDPAAEKDACGVGFIADMSNVPSHSIVEQGLAILRNLAHRGAVGADPKMGDGCGILVQIPHRFFREECAALGHRAAGARALRHRPPVHAPRQGGAEDRPEDRREDDQGGRADAPRLARRAGRQRRSRPVGEGGGAGPEADLRRPPQDGFGRRGFRAAAVPRAKSDLERRLRPQGRAHQGLLPGLPVRPHDRLQGHGAGDAARGLLPGPAGPPLRERARPSPPALRDQHLPDLAACPPLPHGGAQRRDQHAPRQRQLDGGAAGVRRFRPVRQRHLQALADLLRGAVGHGLLRQRLGVPGPRRLLAAARHDDADPRSLGGQSAHGRGPARLLRVPRRADGAVGRPRRDLLHGRPPDRRHPRPQRAAPRPLPRHRRRPRGARLRERRAADPGGADRPEVAAAAGEDAAHRSGAGPHRRRRGDQARA